MKDALFTNPLPQSPGGSLAEVRAYLLASFAFTTMAWLLGFVGFGFVCAKVSAHASQLTHPG